MNHFPVQAQDSLPSSHCPLPPTLLKSVVYEGLEISGRKNTRQSFCFGQHLLQGPSGPLEALLEGLTPGHQ